MEEKKNEVTLFNQSEKECFCSICPETLEDKKKLFNALESCDIVLFDIVGQEINMKDVYCEKTSVLDDETGEVKPKYRTIIFDTDGKTYAIGSYGIYNIMKRIIAIYGAPTWEDGLKVKVIKQKVKDGKSKLSLTLV